MIKSYIPQKTVVLLVLIAQGIVGCASITQGTTQEMTFDINPQYSECNVTGKDGVNLGKVSATEHLLVVPKGKSNLTATCTANNFQRDEISIKSSAQPIGMASFLLDFGITDMLTGAMWAYPSKVTINLKPESPTTTNPKKPPEN